MSPVLTLQRLLFRALLSLPAPLMRCCRPGVPVMVDGRRLAPESQLLLFLGNRLGLGARRGETTPAATRAAFRRNTAVLNGRSPLLQEVRDLELPGHAGSPGVAARLYTPPAAATGAAPGPLLIYAHGGGFVDGDLDSHDGLCRTLAAGALLRILSVGYRLAPEQPFPAGLVDLETAFDWCCAHAVTIGIDPARIGVGGDSSGGNLAAALVQDRLRGAGALPAFLFLLYPLLDLTWKQRSFQTFGEGYGLTESIYDWYMGHYLASGAVPDDLRVSPLLEKTENLAGHPPALIATAGFDILHDDGDAYAQQLATAGAAVDYRCYAGELHGFGRLASVLRTARRDVADLAAGLARIAARSACPTRDDGTPS